MNITTIGFGNGFMIRSSKNKMNPAKLYPVDISTGMPIVTRKFIGEKRKGLRISLKKGLRRLA